MLERYCHLGEITCCPSISNSWYTCMFTDISRGGWRDT